MEIYYRDPYIREIETIILEFGTEGEENFIVPKENLFYLGGGGQPEDKGYVGNIEIKRIEKKKGKVFYFLNELPMEKEIILKVDFERRYSFMQHHSAQHLITAIADKNYGLKTISFHLSEGYGLIDFSGNFGEKVLLELENIVNNKIKEAIPISFEFYNLEEFQKLNIRSRGLPEKFEGMVRIVSIEGIDKNTCGGLHVKNLSEIQMIKFISFEKIKEGIRVYYKAGDELLNFFREKLKDEEEIKKVLNCSPQEFLKVISSWEKEKTQVKKNLKKIKEGIINFLKEGEKNFYFFPGGDMDFLQKMGNHLSLKFNDKTFLLIGEDSENFYFYIIEGENSKEKAEEIFLKIKERIEIKGGGKGKTFQGRGELGSNFDKLMNLAKNLIPASP